MSDDDEHECAIMGWCNYEKALLEYECLLNEEKRLILEVVYNVKDDLKFATKNVCIAVGLSPVLNFLPIVHLRQDGKILAFVLDQWKRLQGYIADLMEESEEGDEQVKARIHEGYHVYVDYRDNIIEVEHTNGTSISFNFCTFDGFIGEEELLDSRVNFISSLNFCEYYKKILQIARDSPMYGTHYDPADSIYVICDMIETPNSFNVKSTAEILNLPAVEENVSNNPILLYCMRECAYFAREKINNDTAQLNPTIEDDERKISMQMQDCCIHGCQ